ncbi:MAG: enoyl-CoA hydratase/isomerase family protein [Desulfobacterales bacterium]|jgi:enoyl-CoA hydratase/carnithine racemase
MCKVILEAHQAVAALRLNNGVTNAISPGLLDDLSDEVKRIQSEFKGMVLAGGEKFFCIGLDLPGLLPLSRSEMVAFYSKFMQVALDLYTLPMPTACALNGHATAGGTIFALCSDFRFASSGRKFIGLNEVKIGVPVPYLADLILRQVVGDRCATEMMFKGEFVEPDKAQEIGLVDAVFSPEDLEEKAVAKIAELAALPPNGLTLIKKNRIEAVRSQYEDMRDTEANLFLDCWFNPSVRELLKAAAKKF